MPDAVGNLFESKQRDDRIYDKGGRLKGSKSCKYQYDDEGKLIEKREVNGNTWRYHWNESGMLEKVVRPDDVEVSFAYDALGRRLWKKYKKTITRFVWDGNKPLHEWKEFDTRESTVDEMITWVFNNTDFSPIAKIKGGKKYSIVADHLGTPIQGYNDEGDLIWQREIDSYGKPKMQKGEAGFCNYMFQGQTLDIETGLSYNRFRYYSPDEGMYISQDPIGLASGELNFYAYVHDPSNWLDVFGLEKCLLSAEDKRKLREMYSDEFIDRPHDHHVVRENAPSNWDDTHRNYILDSQKIISDAGIGLNDDIRNFTRAANGDGAHTKKAAKHVWEQLSTSDNVAETMSDLAKAMNQGDFF